MQRVGIKTENYFFHLNFDTQILKLFIYFIAILLKLKQFISTFCSFTRNDALPRDDDVKRNEIKI